LTLDQLPLHWDELPDKLLIAGGTPQAIAIAQILQQQGKQVTLTCRDRLLPQEEPTLTRRLQASLEADGMEIYTHAPSLQLQEIDGQQWLQAGNHALVSDRVIWAEPTVPDDAGLNLATLGILDGQRLPVNAHLRTAHPQLYACGAVLGGYDLPEIYRQEVETVVANLTHPRPRSMTYHTFAWHLPTEPPLARVGWTFAQARSRFGEKVQLHTFHRGTHPTNPHSQPQPSTP
jgi:pyruvate/2-oxoglutarate dehydrogenase complex dihydrolipoamide dehydrogenase (E3) component